LYIAARHLPAKEPIILEVLPDIGAMPYSGIWVRETLSRFSFRASTGAPLMTGSTKLQVAAACETRKSSLSWNFGQLINDTDRRVTYARLKKENVGQA
jgi:hypothetical protein